MVGMSNVEAAVVLTSESCRFAMDYAWLHMAVEIAVLVFLWRLGATWHFRSAHCFGLVAFAADYCLMYLERGTRTLELLPSANDPSIELSDAPGPIETFVFFLMFYDYVGAFALIVWAREVENLFERNKKPTSTLALISQPLLFWLAPVVAPAIGYDRRIILVNRPSPKKTYFVILTIAIFACASNLKWNFRRVVPIAFAGVGVSLVHHAALFAHNMRGYTSLLGLAVTLCTEWPALIAAERAIRFAFSPPSMHRLAKLLRVGLVGVIVAIIARNIDMDRAADVLLPNIPGHYMQSLGTAAFKARTCGWSREAASSARCRADLDDDSILVVAAPAKSGALLSAQILFELGEICGFCVGSGERAHAGIPGPVEDSPAYPADALHAIINMRKWPDWVAAQNRSYKCVTILRDPLARLRSLYLYARSGGEHWFRYESGLMQALRVSDLSESLEIFWKRFGRDYIEQAHEYDTYNLKQGCIPFHLENFKDAYNTTMQRLIVDAWGLSDDAFRTMIGPLQKHNIAAKSAPSRASNPHISSARYSERFVSDVKARLANMAEVADVIRAQRDRVQYFSGDANG